MAPAFADGVNASYFSPDQPGAVFLDSNGKPITKARFKLLVGKGPDYDVDHQPGRVVFKVYSAADKAKLQDEVHRPVSHVAAGDAVPVPVGKLLDGRPLAADTFRGRYTLVNFFFTTCGPCIAEAPTLSHFAQTHAGVGVLAVTFDPSADATAFAHQHGFTWPVLADAKAWMDTLGVRVYPVLMLVGPDGRMVAATIPSQIEQDKDKGLSEADIDAWLVRNKTTRPHTAG